MKHDKRAEDCADLLQNPSGVTYARRGSKMLALVKLPDKTVVYLALCLYGVKLVTLKHRNACRVVSTVFKPAKVYPAFISSAAEALSL